MAWMGWNFLEILNSWLVESFRLPKFQRILYMEALPAGTAPEIPKISSISSICVARVLEMGIKNENKIKIKIKKGNLWGCGTGEALSSLGCQGAVLGLAEFCPDAQNRHKGAEDPPTEHPGH